MPDSEPAAALGMGRRERRKIATRSELVRAGRKLFGKKGLYEARIEDVAEQAGIAKGTLYLYFRSKEELVRAVVEAGFDDLARHVSESVEADHAFAELVGRIVESHLDFLAANPDLMRIFHQARGILKFRRPEWMPLRHPLERHIDHISRWLARAPSPVRDRPGQRRTIALIIFATISGSTSLRAALDEKVGSRAWAGTLRRGLTALVLELARGFQVASEKTPGGSGS